MKYTTRITLALSITAMTITSLIIFKSPQVFVLTAYPLITGWIIGECLNVPERKIRTKWQGFKDRTAIRIINFADYITGRKEE